jgi:tetratricopeptide (TPR) repeat protein
VEVRGLSRDDSVALLQSPGVDDDLADLQRAALQLDGHPLGLELISGYPSIRTVNWSEERARIAADVLGTVALDPGTEALLEALSMSDGPLPTHALADHLGLTDTNVQQAINEGVQYALLRDDRNTFLSVHPLVKDLYLLRARRDAAWEDRVNDLATRSVGFLRRLEVGTPLYVDTLVNSFRLLGLAGRLQEAIELRADLFGALEQAATELYRKRSYELAVEYFDQVVAADPSNISARLYLARALASVGSISRARAEVNEADDRSPGNPYVARVRGRVEFVAGDLESAVTEYQRALSLRPTYRQVRVDLAQVLIRLENWQLAREYIEPVADENPNPYVLSMYSQVLEHDEQWADAMYVMRRASRLEPENAIYHHRLGRIAEQLGDLDSAVTEYAAAIEQDPANVEAKLSLASILADAGSASDAQKLIDSIQEPSDRIRSVILNIEGKTLLSASDTDGARAKLSEALKLWRSPQNLGLACEIELAAFQKGRITKEVAAMRVQIFVGEMGPESSDYAEQLLSRLDQ